MEVGYTNIVTLSQQLKFLNLEPVAYQFESISIFR
jgi:hypothetical protein